MGGSNIELEATIDKDKETSTYAFSGSLKRLINDADELMFGIKGRILEAAKKYMEPAHAVATDAYLKDPTGKYGTLYANNRLFSETDDIKILKTKRDIGPHENIDDQVQAVVKVKNVEILDVTTQPVSYVTDNIKNESSKKATFNVTSYIEETDTTESSWSVGGEFLLEQMIKYTFNVKGVELGGETKISYTQTWGKEERHSSSITIGKQSGVSVELEPGEGVKAFIRTNKGKSQIKVTYEVRLDGLVATHLKKKTSEGLIIYGLGMDDLLGPRGLNIPHTKEYTEIIDINFVADGQLVLQDADGNIFPENKIISQ